MVQSRPSILTFPVRLNRAKHFRHQVANYNWWTARDTRFCLNTRMQLFHRMFSLNQYIFNYFYFLSFIVPLRRRDIWRAQLRRSEAMKPLRRSNYFSLGHPIIEICFHISNHSCFMSILQEVYNSQPKVVFQILTGDDSIILTSNFASTTMVATSLLHFRANIYMPLHPGRDFLFLLIYGQCSSHCFRAFFAIKAVMTFSLPVKSILIFPRLSQYYSWELNSFFFSTMTSVFVLQPMKLFYISVPILRHFYRADTILSCEFASMQLTAQFVRLRSTFTNFLCNAALFGTRHYINVTVEVLFTSQMFCGVSSWVYSHVPQHYQRNCPLWRCSFIDSLFLFSVRLQLTFAARIKF